MTALTPEMRVAIVTVSDGVSAGARQDRGGPACEAVFADSGLPHRIVSRSVCPDERERVAAKIREIADAGGTDLVVLTGGTGVAPRDRTPEAVRDAIAFEVPGLAEKMRSDTGAAFPAGYLSRQVVGVRAQTLVVALPGSPTGAVDCLRSILSLLPHAVALVRGDTPAHPRPPDGPA
jgi:molybdopterin adenylyltransferase